MNSCLNYGLDYGSDSGFDSGLDSGFAYGLDSGFDALGWVQGSDVLAQTRRGGKWREHVTGTYGENVWRERCNLSTNMVRVWVWVWVWVCAWC